MQAQKPRRYQGSKFAEGRLKLSTACTECHKRKQKCDQQQPCGHCSRRYPPPQCIYRRKCDVAVPTKPSNELEAGGPRSNGHSDPSSSHYEGEGRTNGHSNWFVGGPATLNIEWDGGQHNFNRDPLNDIPMDVQDDFDADSYQTSLSTMITRMSEIVIYSEAGASRRPHQYPYTLGNPNQSTVLSVEPLHFLGITPTAEKASLLSAFVKLLTKYTVSLDGNPTPNYYNTHFVPWSLKSPLLSHLSLFTTAAYQSESLKIPPNSSPIVLSYKITSIRLLNEKLRSKRIEEQTCNEAIAAVAILVAMEWYWSDFETVQGHLKGLVEMVRLRGGLGMLEMHEFLKKMILIVAYNIASTYDLELSFPHNVAILPPHPANVMTPLLSSTGITFATSAEELGTSKETAAILDDMRFLLLSTIKQVDRLTTPQERSKLKITATWTRDRISSLPSGNEPESPLANDFVYRSCRSAALVYCRAITEHIPLSQACTILDLGQLWASMWRISLTRWKQIPGIFLWVLLSAIQGGEVTPYGRFIKSMLKAVCTYLAVDYWDVVDGAGMGFVRLQRWLRSGEIEEGVNVKEGNGENGVVDFLQIYGE